MSYTNMVLGSWRRGEWPEYIMVSHDGMREPGRRYVPERTCRYIYDKEICAWRCSECGGLEPVGDNVSYCPDCGAKVVE